MGGTRQIDSHEVQMVELRPITEDNFIDAFNLRLAPGQEDFVSHPIRSLAQAYVYRDQCQPFGIYAAGRMVGYVMVIYDYDVPEYDIWHMVIDEAEQRAGLWRSSARLRHRLHSDQAVRQLRPNRPDLQQGQPHRTRLVREQGLYPDWLRGRG